MGKKGPGWSSTLPCKAIKSKIYQLFRESVFRWFNSKNNSNLTPFIERMFIWTFWKFTQQELPYSKIKLHSVVYEILQLFLSTS